MNNSSAESQASLGRVLVSVIATAVVFPAVILIGAGDLRWVEGWIFAIWFDVMVLFNILYMYVKDPALLAERSKAPGSDNQKPWDRYVLVAVYAIACVWFVVMPLDAGRYHWSPAFPAWLKIAGAVALLPALYLIERATIENTYLSTLVRIQSERGQHVVSTGVYGLVRHPLYLGCLLMMLGAPLLLGSLYGEMLSLLAVLILCGRILGEEKMLSEELEGYREYRLKVRYRLIPFIW